MMDKVYFRRWLALSLLTLAVIWGNSCLPGQESAAISDGLLGWLLKTLPALGWMDGFILRKMAHFCEFALLGFALGGTCRSAGLRKVSCWFVPAALALLCACVDETIQIVSPGRYSSLVDVWIDFAGALCGLTFLSCLLGILKIKKYEEMT